jgi:hypothetical protein
VYDVRRGKTETDPDFGGPPRRAQSSLVPVLIVLGFGAALIVGLIAATGLAGLYIVLALAGVLGFAGMHYVLWGWWLSNKIRREQEAEDSDASDV